MTNGFPPWDLGLPFRSHVGLLESGLGMNWEAFGEKEALRFHWRRVYVEGRAGSGVRGKNGPLQGRHLQTGPESVCFQKAQVAQ